MNKKIVTHSADETIAYGKKIAAILKGGEVFALKGELGAGKTTFIQGVAQGLGIKRAVTSPTFILMNVYRVQNSKFKIQNLVHIDCYRIHTEDDIRNIGADEYFGRDDSVVFVEWPEKIPKLIRGAREITFEFAGEDKRRISMVS